jgi:branched-chain amino acid aminotransferase
LELATEHFSVEERMIDPRELSTCDEAFVTSTSKRVIPATTIDALQVGTGLV